MPNETKDYADFLESKNGYCSCKQMQPLFKLRKEAEDLEKKCEIFARENTPGEHEEADKPFLQDFKKQAEAFEETAEKYHALLTEYAQRNQVKFKLHDSKERRVIGTINSRKINSLLSDSDVPITIHCSTCDQQIDLAS